MLFQIGWTQQEVSDKISVHVDREFLKKDSQIYGACSDSTNLTKYQKSINDAAFQLCLENPSLVKTRGMFLDLARKKVDSEGYTYVKKRSRSKRFGTESGYKEAWP